MFFDMTPDPQDLTLVGSLDLKDGTLTAASGSMMLLASFSVPASTQGSPIRVFVGKHIMVGDLFVTDSTTTGEPQTGQAIAILATADLEVTGRISVDSGAIDIVGCTGGSGQHTLGMNSSDGKGGGGGGGHASAGASGGSVGNAIDSERAVGGVIGEPSGTAELVPLRGGCPGGNRGGTTNHGFGGGAIQLVSKISIMVSGAVIVDGNQVISSASGGGGGGGGILVEAPTVTFAPSAKLLARGGGGGAGDGHSAGLPLDDGSAIPGGVCSPFNMAFGNGGDGASLSIIALPGGDTRPLDDITTFDDVCVAGDGGGGIGTIRVNTDDASFTTSNTVILAGSFSAGVVSSK